MIAMLKGAARSAIRPVSLTFRIADRAAPSQAVTFAQEGSLGIKFTPKDGRIEILQVERSGCIVFVHSMSEYSPPKARSARLLIYRPRGRSTPARRPRGTASWRSAWC